MSAPADSGSAGGCGSSESTGSPLRHSQPIDSGWRFARTAPNRFDAPESIPVQDLSWSPISVPGTVASALVAERSGLGAATAEECGEPESFLDLDDTDCWLHAEFDVTRDGATDAAMTSWLVFHGLATIADIWLNDAPLGRSENMFVAREHDVTALLRDSNSLWICFRALSPHLESRGSRARWRTQLVANRNLRNVRTSLLGRMPSWCPPWPIVGPWRPIELVSTSGPRVDIDRLRPRIEGSTGVLELNLRFTGPGFDEPIPDSEPTAVIHVGETQTRVTCRRLENGLYEVQERIRLPNVEAWWPHTHGEPTLYPVDIEVDTEAGTQTIALGRVGFRKLELAGPPGPDFDLRINGESIFWRGSCWTPIDPLAFDESPETLRAALEMARAAGMNMLRVSGTMVYESDLFYALCDELGLMVWQDFMFATLDYPDRDEAFRENVRKEARGFLRRTEHRACLAVLCGNAEGQQQPAMLGLTADTWKSRLFDSLLPQLCHELRPDLPYWPSTPSGGTLPFHPGHGTSHYFGVGAYRRPLEDAELAVPRFATECLAFSNLPDRHGDASIERALGSLRVGDATRRRAPRDRGADWDFADVTDHYLELLYDTDAAALRRDDPGRHACLSRATSAEVLFQTQALWRRQESRCRGSLVWLHRDPWPCAGWGILDSEGRPKAAYYGLKRAWQPIAVSVVDRGLEGLVLVSHNDRPEPLEATLECTLMGFDGRVVQTARETLQLSGQSATETSIDALMGGFLDSSHAYRFGPRSFDCCVARILARRGGDEIELARAVHLPRELGLLETEALGLRAQWIDCADAGVRLSVSTERFAQTVSLDLGRAVASENYFHLAPGHPQVVEVRNDRAINAPIESVRIEALNGDAVLELDSAVPNTPPAIDAAGASE